MSPPNAPGRRRTILPGRFCALLLLLLALGPAWAQQPRPVPLPENALYGELKGFRYPEARIGSRVLRLSPGARVYNTRNLIIMPASVPSHASVVYRLDIRGQISQMWLLTPSEAAAAKRRATAQGTWKEGEKAKDQATDQEKAP